MSEKELWVVGLDRPYYPSVEFFNNEAEALKEYERIIKEEVDEDGEYNSKAFMAKIKYVSVIKTHY
jgi:hypothetical protein